jgi:hypothetical protein
VTDTRVFGIRHHGPGSARALALALEEMQPDAVLIEGPPEANPLLSLAGSAEMRPPVALLAYLPATPSRAGFWPLATFSPEWVALRWAASHGVTAEMIDLPAAVTFGWEEPDQDPLKAGEPTDLDSAEQTLAVDPLGVLAQAAGYDDAETWWEDVVELRGTGEGPWEAIAEAMAQVRTDVGDRPGHHAEVERAREAAMRTAVRAAERRAERVAVVCGAWHVPALLDRPSATSDRQLLAGLPKEKVAVTWVPWSDNRLSFRSGYGAGVSSPGWYSHLHTAPDRPVERWLTRTAVMLREEGLDASPASVVEAVRLAGTLATLRGRPLAGLTECLDATRAVLTAGAEAPLQLLVDRLIVGDGIGQVPPETPTVPLAADLTATARRLRLKTEVVDRTLTLDLRGDTDLARSQLLHRLVLLGVGWGRTDEEASAGTGTFRETWQLAWAPELSVAVIEASLYGTTVPSAATARVIEKARAATGVAGVVGLVGDCLLAELPAALAAVMATLDAAAAVAADIGELMDAVVPLARAARYGTVRRSDADAVAGVVAGLVTRIVAGLAPAAASLDDESASLFAGRLSGVSASLAALDDGSLRDRWLDAVVTLSAAGSLHGLVAGRATRLAADARRLPAEEVARRLSAALSIGADPASGAAWVAGLLAGSGLLLVHDPVLLRIVDEWLTHVDSTTFEDLLPVLRRAFADFEAAERRLLAGAIAQLDRAGPPSIAGPSIPLDVAAAAAVVPTLVELLGLSGPSKPEVTSP